MIMKTWNDYKEYVKTTDPDIGKDLTDIEEQARILSNHPESYHSFENTTSLGTKTNHH